MSLNLTLAMCLAETPSGPSLSTTTSDVAVPPSTLRSHSSGVSARTSANFPALYASRSAVAAWEVLAVAAGVDDPIGVTPAGGLVTAVTGAGSAGAAGGAVVSAGC